MNRKMNLRKSLRKCRKKPGQETMKETLNKMESKMRSSTIHITEMAKERINKSKAIIREIMVENFPKLE